MSQIWRTGLARWIAVVSFILGIIATTQVVVGMDVAGLPIRKWILFWTTMAGWLWLALAVPGILWLSRRFPLGTGNWGNLPIHTIASIGLSVVHAVPNGADRLRGHLAHRQHSRFH